MENKRLSKAWLGHIPEELWPNILSRLPVKCLLRFRCVSRSWLSLINDPDFCRLHLKSFQNNIDETRLLVVQCAKENFVLRCSDTFEKDTGTPVNLGIRAGDERWEERWQFECCVDGLVLFSSRWEHLMVWNPSIRKFHDIPSMPKIIEISPDDDEDEHLLNVEIGLGYDVSIKDYKHVRFLFMSDEILLHSVAVYTLGAASWKIIQSQDKGFPDWPLYLDSWENGSVYLQGSLYLIAIVEDRNVLVSIDLSSEVFCRTSFPDVVHPKFDGQLILVDGGRSLAIFDFDFGNMWVWGSSGAAERESMCWTKRYSFGLRVPELLYFNKSGDMLMQWCREKTAFTLATGKEFVQLWTLISSYNPQTQEEKILLQKECHKLQIHRVCGYIESLTLL